MRSERSLTTLSFVPLVTEPSASSSRARPMSVEDRRSSIIEAVIPLLAVHGRDVTSKQIAEAAGVAEGTIFRAFGDKDSLITAAIAEFLDPGPLLRELEAIDPHVDLHTKVLRIVTLMRGRFTDIFRIMSLVGHERPQHNHRPERFVETITKVLATDLDYLDWPADRVAHVIRLLTFSSSVPHLNDGISFSPEELTTLILHGITGKQHPHDDVATAAATSLPSSHTPKKARLDSHAS